MKASKYNFFSKTANNEIIAYNAISAALAKMDEEHYREYKLIEEGKAHLSRLADKRKKEVHGNLAKGSFIFDDDQYDEFDVISTSYNMNRYHTNFLSLTIAPTMACNFNCYYCYEKKGSVKISDMNEHVETEILRFVDKVLKDNSRLSITWYGGEPLLKKEIIIRLSENFQTVCDKKKSDFTASIVTNGFYLDKDTVDQLVKYKVSVAQVTIDGPKEEHDSRRFDKIKGASFERIIENLKYASSFMRIIVRVNLDRGNIDKMGHLLDYFHENGLTQNISVYPGRVSECDYDMGSNKNLLFSPKEYYEKEYEIIKKAIEENNQSLGYPYPNPSVIPCGAVNYNTFSIDPEGNVYKCWEVLGEKDEAVFHISEPNLYSKKQLKWVNWDPKDKKECRECKHLPICNGGCVLHAMKGRKTCSYWKDHLDDMLAILAHKFERDRKEKRK